MQGGLQRLFCAMLEISSLNRRLLACYITGFECLPPFLLPFAVQVLTSFATMAQPRAGDDRPRLEPYAGVFEASIGFAALVPHV